MTPETRILVQSRLDRAREALAEAVLLLDSGHANTGVNRVYYACFYAVSALLLTKGLTATSHSGLRTLFHQHLIRPGLLPLGQGPLYNRLFDQRQRSDYADLVHCCSGSLVIRDSISRTLQGANNLPTLAF